MRVFFEATGQVSTRAMLMEYVFDLHLSNLRRKLGPQSDGERESAVCVELVTFMCPPQD